MLLWSILEKDVTPKPQLSTTFRFVDIGKVHERFVGFVDVTADRTSDGLFRHVVKVEEDVYIKDTMAGQTYDGTRVVSDHVNGLQKKILDYPFTVFTHCYAQVLI